MLFFIKYEHFLLIHLLFICYKNICIKTKYLIQVFALRKKTIFYRMQYVFYEFL